MFRLLFPLLFIGIVSFGNAQDYYFEDFVYDTNIKSVKLNPAGDPLAYPFVKLNGGKKLHLGFDDLDAVDKRYTYKIVHCDRDWNPTEIDEMEYLEGFNGEEIRDSYHSMHTRQNFIHYDLYLPNDYLNWTISGNYLLVVMNEYEETIISKRFMVVEPHISVYVEFKRPKSISKLKTHHSLDLSINFEDFYIRDPLNELTVTVLQNFRWFDGIYNVAPKNAIGNNLKFDIFDPFIFPALKEFRNFDIRSLRYTSRYVYAIEARPHSIDVILEKDKKRTYSNFLSDPDANGNFITGSQDSRYGERGAEYVKVAFTLDSPLEFEKQDVFVMGGFSDWQAYDTHQMTYDKESGSYQADIVLKQGYYDYYYALVDDEGNINLNSLEGNWYETDNTYQVLVYLREFGSYYDKLIAMYSVRK